MAFEKSIHLPDCKYRYTISSNVKKFTLRDTTFVQNKIGQVSNCQSQTNLAFVTLISLKMKTTISYKKNSTS